MIRQITVWIAGTSLKKTNLNIINVTRRGFADIPKKDTSSHVMVRTTDKDEQMRVRRARAADVPRVLKFVREHTRDMWPALTIPSNASQLVLSDYVSRALAQGHSMIAERQESKHNWSKIKALALSTTTCKWDASVLEKWARCVQCSRSRQALMFTAHCLRAPALHDKYHVHSILQVILIVPEDVSKQTELVNMLVKSAIQRGRDVGFSLVRFDAANEAVIKALEQMKMNKEWQIAYDVLPDCIKEREKPKDMKYCITTVDAEEANKYKEIQFGPGHSLSVYSTFTDTKN
ncbi:unnamed protein product, partial [Iphiclides podalirius]